MPRLWHNASRLVWMAIAVLVALALATLLTACNSSGNNFTPPPATIIRSSEGGEPTTTAVMTPTPTGTPSAYPAGTSPAAVGDAPASVSTSEHAGSYPLPTLYPTSTPEPYPTKA